MTMAINRTATTGLSMGASLPMQEAIVAGSDERVEYLDAKEQENSQYQLLWNEWMEQGNLSSSPFYQKVSVILISWDVSFDDLGTKEEAWTG